MTKHEFDEWQEMIAEEFSAEEAIVGRWAQEGAVQGPLTSNTEVLPLEISTPRMPLLRAVDSDGAPVGRAWVGLDHPRGAPDTAFL